MSVCVGQDGYIVSTDLQLVTTADGDVLIVTKPDRLARSTTHLLSIVADLNARGVGLILLSMGGAQLDTRNPTSELILTIMGGIATWERAIMLERQREGIAKARAEGKFKGGKTRIDHGEMLRLAADLGPEIRTSSTRCSRRSSRP